MDIPQTKWLTYRQAFEWSRRNPLRLSEIPLEHAISLPLPTLRYEVPGYIQFAAPSVRKPDEPSLPGAADRWWVIDARGGRLALYALTAALPIGAADIFKASEVGFAAGGVAELRGKIAEFEAAMETAVVEFFAVRRPPQGMGDRITDLLRAIVPVSLVPQYQAIAADFFAWLGG